MPAFIDPRVGMVQAPQDHRDGRRSLMHHAMNGEYAGFFDIGMVQRNEANAIIVHGTMCLIRRAALITAGSWSSDTIVEDCDLGLQSLEHGWQIHYTNRRYGHGLLPDTFDAYKKQRYRWAYGGLQIIKKHWRIPAAWRRRPDGPAEARIQLWLAQLARRGGARGIWWRCSTSPGCRLSRLPALPFPIKILTIPILAAFLVTLAHFIALYRLRVSISPGQMIGAVIAAMAVQWTVARAVGCGMWKESLPFMRTAKGGATRKGPDFPAFWEAVIAMLLIAGAATVVITNHKQIDEINIFALVLLVQSLPFLAAVAIAALEGSRFNEFAYWRGVEEKMARCCRVSGRGKRRQVPPTTASVGTMS